MTDDAGRELVAAIAELGTTAEIMRTHVSDGRGRCCGCHLDDKQRKPWPCGVLKLAWAAVGPDRPTP